MSVTTKAEYTSMQQIRFDIPSCPHVLAAEGGVPNSLTSSSTSDKRGMAKSSQ